MIHLDYRYRVDRVARPRPRLTLADYIGAILLALFIAWVK